MSTHLDEQPNARARARRMGVVSRPRFEDYQEKCVHVIAHELLGMHL
jgi:hypothetical protein